MISHELILTFSKRGRKKKTAKKKRTKIKQNENGIKRRKKRNHSCTFSTFHLQQQRYNLEMSFKCS